KRTGKKGQEVAEKDPVWEIVASYIAQCAYNTTLMLSPDVIIFGGGVMKQTQLKMKVQEKFLELLNDYVSIPKIADYIVTPKLGDHAGITGCLALAKEVKQHSA
ncbi:TPA: ROK family protein, partial [Enterococcus faecium]|nr:ROK family protein [Enterococcus faecium]